MTITLHLPPEEEQEIKQRAALRGQDVDAYVHQLISIEIKKKPVSLFEAAEPFARAIEKSGMTDEEFFDFFEGVREEIRNEKHPAASIPSKKPRDTSTLPS